MERSYALGERVGEGDSGRAACEGLTGLYWGFFSLAQYMSDVAGVKVSWDLRFSAFTSLILENLLIRRQGI